ncbi:MAG TPA: excinuclease ABC subunit UvrC, partial [Pseudomonadota bacterium]|nr:excinuclease ABC subunit UvrC [Pseudomonadota bacterium]
PPSSESSSAPETPASPGSVPVAAGASPDPAAPCAEPAATAPGEEAPAEAALIDPAPTLSIDELVERLPQEPGVYLMKDKKGRIIYVGKAGNLRQRVRSYFSESSGDGRAFIRLLNRLLGDIETMVTNNEKEALLLENILIKRHKPRFNVKLVDDKNYLALRLDPKARYPRLEVVRRIRDDGARYFGPYHSAGACRQTLQVVNRHFKLRTCTDHVLNSRSRPCLQYQIKRCDAPCVFPLPPSQYGEQVRDVGLFLDGKNHELLDRLRARMMQASDETRFEVAAALRDQLRSLERTLEEQRIVSAQFLDQDIFGYFRQGDVMEVAVLQIRQGKLLGRRSFRFAEQEFPDHESISAFVGLYYDASNAIPDEVLLPIDIEDLAAKQEWLRERRVEHSTTVGVAGDSSTRARVEVLVPKRGPRRQLVELANKNAAVNYSTRRNQKRDVEDSLAKLQRRLGLKRLPQRIECFDISHLQGSDTVASRVVFVNGEPARSEYRTFKVRSVGNDDFSAMYEVLSRRFRRARQLAEAEAATTAPSATPEAAAPPSASTPTSAPSGYSPAAQAARRQAVLISARDAGTASYRTDAAASGPGSRSAAAESAGAADALILEESAVAGEAAMAASTSSWALPDLLVIDGGKGQLATALVALKDVGINWSAELDVIGLAKERTDSEGEEHPDRVFLPRTKDPIRLRPNTAEMFVLSRIRDEAHRFAVGFHRKLRKKRSLQSQLDEIRGLGPKRRAALLRGLGSVKAIRAASLDELSQVEGMTKAAAAAVYAYFHTVHGHAVHSPPASDAKVGPPPPTTTAEPEPARATPPRGRGTHRAEAHTVGESAAASLSAVATGAGATSNPTAAAPEGPAELPAELEDAAAQELAALTAAEGFDAGDFDGDDGAGEGADADGASRLDDADGSPLQELARTASRREKSAEPS